ncbi:MAG: ankyrin repeat domain-containing protein, partial [Desulfobacterales bacterium]
MTTSRRQNFQKLADILTLICLAAAVILVLFAIFGPKSGPEAMIILIPWMLAGAVHLTLGIGALVCAWLSGAPWRNSWIYVYFLLFFGINGYHLVIANQMDIAAVRKLDDFRAPAETELYELLRLRPTPAISTADAGRARELVRAGADLNYRRPGTHRPLIVLAAAAGDPDLVRLMLTRGADANGPVDSAYTPLMAAVRRGHTAVAAVLLEHGAPPDAPRYTSATPLMAAAQNDDLATLQVLLAAGADPDARTTSAGPPLITAAAKGDARAVQALLNHGADPNILAFAKATPMLKAVEAGCTPCVRLLAEAGAGAVGRNGRGETPLVIAIQNDRPDIVAILANANPPPGSAADLFHAARQPDPDLLETLLSLGVDPDARNDQGDTLLLYLSANSPYRRQTPEAAVAVARILLDNGADSEAATPKGRTPLVRAAKNGHTTLARLLIEKGADVNTTTDDGRTPLMESLWAGHSEIAAALVGAGADPSQAVRWGINGGFPLKAAASIKDTAMVAMLIEAGARVDPESRDLCDLLQQAAPYPEMVWLIAASGVDLNQRDPLNRYPLTVVKRNGPPESVAIMIAAGADPALAGQRSKPPLIQVVETGQADMVRAFLDENPH